MNADPLDELARRQDVRPIEDVRALACPGGLDADLAADAERLRHPERAPLDREQAWLALELERAGVPEHLADAVARRIPSRLAHHVAAALQEGAWKNR